ncbi:MAG TPA: hypothetical protein VK797_15740 [Tepidisphaeraceae bacterium]|jgi:hypothetical protein|nr:hypothetical protein [Tepidisphaeraceae bacterium]
MRLLADAFTSLPRELQRAESGQSGMLDHAKCVEMRSDLALLVPPQVVEWLPIVLYDLTMHRESCREEDGEMVAYFLDPIVRPPSRHDEEIVDKFAKSCSSEEDGQRLRDLMLTEPPWPARLSEMSAEQRLDYQNASNEQSFSLFNERQDLAVLAWLEAVRTWDCFRRFCPEDLARAIQYWQARVNARGQG